MDNSSGEISHRFGKNKTETFLVRRQRSVQEIKKTPCRNDEIINETILESRMITLEDSIKIF